MEDDIQNYLPTVLNKSLKSTVVNRACPFF